MFVIVCVYVYTFCQIESMYLEPLNVCVCVCVCVNECECVHAWLYVCVCVCLCVPVDNELPDPVHGKKMWVPLCLLFTGNL